MSPGRSRAGAARAWQAPHPRALLECAGLRSPVAAGHSIAADTFFPYRHRRRTAATALQRKKHRHERPEARRLPDSELVIYPDAGHGGIFQYHREFVTKALAFLARP